MPVTPLLGRFFNIFSCILCLMQLQMAIFDFEEAVTGTEHVAILCHTTVLAQPMMSSVYFLVYF